MLSYNPLIRSYDRVQHVIIMDLDLVQSYSNINFAKPIIKFMSML